MLHDTNPDAVPGRRTAHASLRFSAASGALLFATGLLFAAPQAFAQDGTGATELGDIIVTAQHRAENLQDVPIAVSAVTGDALANAGVTSTQDLIQAIPGVNIRNTTGSFQPFIRGVGTGSALVENPVTLYIDGFYYAMQRDANRQLPDVEQVSVIKGPQGTLFGRNATGGVIQVTTRSPSQTPGFEVSTSFDNYETSRSELYVTGGLSDRIAANFSASYTTQGEGWGTNLVTGNDVNRIDHDLNLRTKIRYVDDKNTLTFIADYTDREDSYVNPRPFPGRQPLPSGGYTEPDDVRDVASPIDGYTLMESSGVSLTYQRNLNFADFVSMTAYRSGDSSYLFDAGGTPVLLWRVEQDYDFSQFTQEFQLVSAEGGRFDWTAGAFYFDFDEAVQPQQADIRADLTGFALSHFDNYTDQVTESLAGYAQGTYSLTDATRLTAGVRYTWEDRDFFGTRNRNLGNGAPLPPIVRDENLTSREWTYRLALDHNFSEDVLGYVSYNTGFKSGGFNLNDPSNPPYLPETLSAYEIGLKSELWDRRVRLNLAGFYYDYENLQVSQFVSTPVIVNGAQAEIYGLDADFQVWLTDNFRITGGLSLLHSEFTEFAAAQCNTVNPGGGQTLFSCDASGNRTPFAQRYNLVLAADYDRDYSFGNLAFNVNNSANDGYFFEPDNDLYQGSYNLLNASVTWTSADERYSAKLWASNILDEDVATMAYVFSFISTAVQYATPPRLIGATLRVRY